MEIYGPAHVHGAHAINSPHMTRTNKPAPESQVQATGDQLELSEAGQIASRLSEMPDIRADRVAEIRAAIAEGTYETDEKLTAALDRLLDEIG